MTLWKRLKLYRFYRGFKWSHAAAWREAKRRTM